MKTYLTWLRKAMDRLDERYAVLTQEPMLVEEVFSYAGALAEDAGERAARLGLSALYDDSLNLLGATNPMTVKSFLAKCIAVCGQSVNADGPFDVAEAAKRLSVSRGTIYALVESGKLLCSRIGKGRGTIRIPLAALEAYQRDARGTAALAPSETKRKRLLKL
jgi:excisionase family DNA binding protein